MYAALGQCSPFDPAEGCSQFCIEILTCNSTHTALMISSAFDLGVNGGVDEEQKLDLDRLQLTLLKFLRPGLSLEVGIPPSLSLNHNQRLYNV